MKVILSNLLVTENQADKIHSRAALVLNQLCFTLSVIL